MSNKIRKVSLVRALSKMGFCSRTKAKTFIKLGIVSVNDKIVYDEDYKVNLITDKIKVAGKTIIKRKFIYLMLNKPRGLITTLSDEKNRATVYDCFRDYNMPYVIPVGRLDKASEGLLFFTNDTGWASKLTDPKNQIQRIYHVQINFLATNELCEKLQNGIEVDNEVLRAKKASILRKGIKNSWLEITLCEGKNRHIRRLLKAFNIKVLRLIRVSYGGLELGSLPKGKWRFLSASEVRYLYNLCKQNNRN